MTRWLTRISRALAMGLAWAVTWLPFGLIIGLIVDRDGSMDEPWIAVGTFPGFFCGLVFSIVTGFATSRRPLGELSASEAGVRGAMSGLLVAGLWFLAAVSSDPIRWGLTAGVMAGVTVLGAFTGIGSMGVTRALKDGAGASAA